MGTVLFLVLSVEDYIKSELIGKGFPRHKHYLTSLLLLSTAYISTHAMYC